MTGRFKKKLCSDYGIGLLVYSTRNNKVEQIVGAKLNRIKSTKLLSRLTDYNKKSLPGSKSGDSSKITAYSVTCDNMRHYVQRHTGCTIKEMMDNISHHYENDRSAVSNAYQCLHNGYVKGIEKRNGKLYLQNESN